MSSSLLEAARCGLEEMDGLESLGVEVLNERVSGAKATMERDQIVARVAREMAARAGKITTMQRDESLREELGGMRGPTVFTTFYGQLKQTREYYARHANVHASNAKGLDSLETVIERARDVTDAVDAFSGEEVWGKYVDMAKLHLEFCNLPGFGSSTLDYASYLRMMLNRPFAMHLVLPGESEAAVKRVKGTAAYAHYVNHVDAYLSDFWRRAQPLADLSGKKEGEEGETNGGVSSATLNMTHDTAMKVEETTTNGEEASNNDAKIDLSQFHSADELAALGLDRLKAGLKALGLKCGGDAATRAKRLYSVKGLEPHEIDPRLRAKKGSTTNNGGVVSSSSDAAPHSNTGGKDGARRRVAETETRVERLLSRLGPTVEASLRRAERKLTRTKEEIDQELYDEEFGATPNFSQGGDAANGAQDDADAIIQDENATEDPTLDGPIYNPKNLPLGWDGKPIPYWLYKLHGLDLPFSCEICGNITYYGRRAFEQHFNEWRHAHGMRCLRIPNTRHFHGVTKMDDAVALWEQLQERADKERFNPARDEEYEDSDGNVLNRATYEDLARQGLL